MKKPRKTLNSLEAPYIQSLKRLIETQSKATLAAWVLDYSEAVMLTIWRSHYPEDRRPEAAIAAARAWLAGSVKLPQAKRDILACHAAARDAEANPAAQAAARAIGQSASVIHSPRHCLGLPLYGALAVAYSRLEAGSPWEEIEACAAEECARMEAALRAIAVIHKPDTEFFTYGDRELDYLKRKDKKLGQAIDQIGFIRREVNPDLFSTVVRTIIGQQISGKAQATVWKRLNEGLGSLTADSIVAAGPEKIQQFGTSHRKASYIVDFAARVKTGEFDLMRIREMPDNDVIRELTELKGIGVWTAEMLMIFCLQRADILSFGDLAIQRGLRMLYGHKTINRERFERYRRRYSPYGSVASLYLWEIAGGAIKELKDNGTRQA